MTSRPVRGKIIARRSTLLASAAGFGLALTAPAHAQASPDGVENIAQGAPDLSLNIAQSTPIVADNIAQAAPIITVDSPRITAPTPDQLTNIPQIVVQGAGQGYTPDDILDDAVDVTGVGMFYRADGFVCSGTLINPRTVLFAAHCVNDVPSEYWGTNVQGIPAAWSFGADALPGFIDWVQSGYQSNPDAYVYNVNGIVWNDESTARPEDLGFLQGDVALASLDTPAANVPTWAILFSALPAPASIDSADGTGYHVKINGYGTNGYGSGEMYGIDWRRRAAENMIGILGSISDRGNALFGTLLGFSGYPDDTYTQNLYQLDFDDPDREAWYDFNIFRDDARDPEGITAGGDSGGPLILDQTFAQEVVIGVLSGGSRYYGASQDFSTYGTSSFYQPLYLFWDWIVANSPYRYVSAKDGNGQWTDPNHWVTDLDPNFMVIDANGNLVNGLPTTAGAGAFGDDPTTKFGQVCDGSTYCVDLTTGEIVQYDSWGGLGVGAGGNSGGQPTGNVTNGLGVVSGLGDYDLGDAAQGGSGDDVAVTQAPPAQNGLPTASIDNGLPGASGFVPNNQDYDPYNGIRPFYFDVTLSGSGLTTLSNADIMIDRLTILSGNASLEIDAGASLTSLMGIDQYAGFTTVNGTLTTLGDYTLFGGGLLGNGTIVAPYTTAILGAIAPGSLATIGTLNFNGDLILSSASGYYVNVGNNGLSDLIAVHATQFANSQVTALLAAPAQGSPIPLNGMASIGGTLVISPVQGVILRPGDHYTILTAEGGIFGQFDDALNITAVLKPVLSYNDTSVEVDIEAGSYADAVDPNAPVQLAYAQLLDQNRDQYDKYPDLYLPIDMFGTDAVRALFDSLAPRTQNAAGEMGLISVNALGNFFRTRLNTVAGGGTGGTIAMTGQPLQLAALAVNSMPGAAPVRSDVSDGMAVTDGALPETMSVYLSGGYINGHGQGLPIATPNGRNNFDGFFIAGGIEGSVGADTTIGFGLGYVDTDGSTAVGGDKAGGKLYQGTLYAVTRTGSLQLDVQVSAGAYKWNTSRVAVIGPSIYTLTADDSAFVFSAEGGVGAPLAMGSATITPRASLRYNLIDFNRTAEKGGGPALQYDLGSFDSLEGRLGATLSGDMGGFKPFLTANYVHDFNPRTGAFGANFVGGIGPNALFGLAGADKDWGELSGGISYSDGKVDLSLAADTTVGRSDVSNQTYRGSVTFHF